MEINMKESTRNKICGWGFAAFMTIPTYLIVTADRTQYPVRENDFISQLPPQLQAAMAIFGNTANTGSELLRSDTKRQTPQITPTAN